MMEKAIEETAEKLPVAEINMEEISNFHALKAHLQSIVKTKRSLNS
jgi:hypothetical protein